jgi:hypothetical protein
MGRGPVCGIMTRRGTTTGPAAASGAGVGSIAGVGSFAGADSTTALDSVTTGTEEATGASTAGVAGTTGAAATGAAGTAGATATGRPGGVAGGGTTAMAGRGGTCAEPETPEPDGATGGLATTTPAGTGGLAATVGAAGAWATMFAPCRGRGTILRGATVALAPAGEVDCAGEDCVGAETGLDAAAEGAGEVEAAATTTGPRAGGANFAAASALRRSRIAFSASPGFETFERLNAGRAGAAGRLVVLARPPFLK